MNRNRMSSSARCDSARAAQGINDCGNLLDLTRKMVETVTSLIGGL
jgi:hypothetical protein